MNQKRRVARLAIACLASLVIAGCCCKGASGPMGGGPTPTPTPTPAPVVVSAPSGMVQIARTIQFTANVIGTANQSVTWAVNNITGGNSTVGTITPTGLFTAPNSVPNPNKVTVTATSMADTAKSGSADITIAPIQMSYGYDQNGQRVFSSNGITTTLYPTKLYNTDGTTPTKHIFANGELIATIQGSGASAITHIVATDHLTGSNVVSDTSGNIQEVLDYYPFGGTRLDEHQGFNEQRKFAGHEFDQDTGLSYMDARYYQPNRGQFLSEDPVFLAVGNPDSVGKITGQYFPQVLADPQHLNPYTYARDNPIDYFDPSGQDSIDSSVLSWINAKTQPVVNRTPDPSGLESRGSRMPFSTVADNETVLNSLQRTTGLGDLASASADFLKKTITESRILNVIGVIGTGLTVYDELNQPHLNFETRLDRAVGKVGLSLPPFVYLYAPAKVVAPKQTEAFANLFIDTVAQTPKNFTNDVIFSFPQNIEWLFDTLSH